jgi:hypothetical protein
MEQNISKEETMPVGITTEECRDIPTKITQKKFHTRMERKGEGVCFSVYQQYPVFSGEGVQFVKIFEKCWNEPLEKVKEEPDFGFA